MKTLAKFTNYAQAKHYLEYHTASDTAKIVRIAASSKRPSQFLVVMKQTTTPLPVGAKHLQEAVNHANKETTK